MNYREEDGKEGRGGGKGGVTDRKRGVGNIWRKRRNGRSDGYKRKERRRRRQRRREDKLGRQEEVACQAF